MRWRLRWPLSAAKHPGCPRAATGPPSPFGRFGWPGRARSRPAPRPATSCATSSSPHPEPVRQQLAGLPSGRQAEVAVRFRPGDPACPAEGAKTAMASVARRHQQLTAEITRLDAMLDELVRHAAPQGFLAKRGVAIQVAATLLITTGDNPGRVRREASFAALCGASPVDASSGKQLRHRLNRGGDRHANAALWTIAMTRLAHDPAPRPTPPGTPPRARTTSRRSAASLEDYRFRGPDSRAVVPRSRWGMASLPGRCDGQF